MNLNFTVMQDKVANRSKQRTYRQAKCIHAKKNKCTKGGLFFNKIPLCYLNCNKYEYRFKKGTTLHLYTGLRQRKWCTSDYCSVGLRIKETGQCNSKGRCNWQGALLLRTDLPECTDTYPIRMKDITEEDARLDGFEYYVSDWSPHDKNIRDNHTSALRQLKYFLIKNYDAKPDTPIQAIIWED